jgi:hypothetical protein
VKGRPTRVLPRIRPVARVKCRVGQHLDDPHLLGGLELFRLCGSQISRVGDSEALEKGG